MMHEDTSLTTYKAGADLSDNQYYAVKLNGTDQTVALATATTDDALILVNAPESGEAALVCTGKRCKAKIGGSVTAGNLLGPDTDGMLNVRSTAGDKFCARAREDGADGDIIDVEVISGGSV